MDININEGTKKLHEKYKLSPKPKKAEIVEKILLFLNDNKSFRPYDKRKLSYYVKAIKEKKVKPLHNDLMALNSNSNKLCDFFAAETEDGTITIFKKEYGSIIQLNNNFNINTLKFIYDSFVKNIGDYSNSLIRLNNLKNECDKHGKVFFIKNQNNAIYVTCIKDLTYNTIKNEITFTDVKIIFDNSLLNTCRFSKELTSTYGIFEKMYYFNDLFTQQALSEQEFRFTMNELLEKNIRQMNNTLNDFNENLSSL